LQATRFTSFRSRTALQIEILSLRHQLGVLQRSVKRPNLKTADRLLWVWLSTVWSGWRSSVFIVQAATVIAWHRKGFRLFWKPGRLLVPREIRELIRTMNRENPMWGAPRIHGALLKLGNDIGETSVRKKLFAGEDRPHRPGRHF
jgi:putative transposase